MYVFFYPWFLRMAFFWHIPGTMDDSSKEMQEDCLPVNPDADPSNVTSDNETEVRGENSSKLFFIPLFFYSATFNWQHVYMLFFVGSCTFVGS